MKRAIFCLHGLGSSKRSFEKLLQTGLGDHDPVVFDFAGFGQRCNEPVSGDPFETAICEIGQRILSANYQDIILVGHSMGGIIALSAAEALGDKVTGIVSIEGNLIGEDCGTMSRTLATAKDAAAREEVIRQLRLSASQSKHDGWRTWAEDMETVSVKTLTAYARSMVEFSDSGKLIEFFEHADCRTAYIHGDECLRHPVLSRLKRVPVSYIPGSGHFVMQDKPHECARVILDKILS
jgi:pimeloyl-ACP methyl ester carboxylesterase